MRVNTYVPCTRFIASATIRDNCGVFNELNCSLNCAWKLVMEHADISKYFKFDVSNKTLTFSYDGFLDGSNVDEMTISHDSRANVIEPSDGSNAWLSAISPCSIHYSQSQ